MKLFVSSLGCSKNQVDTEVMLGLLAREGWRVVDQPEEADCLLINTCAFLIEAVQESLDSIVELARCKGKGGPARLVVAGCLVSRYREEILKEIPEVDALVRPDDLEGVVGAVIDSPGSRVPGPGFKAHTPSPRLRRASTGRGTRDVGPGSWDAGPGTPNLGRGTRDVPFPPRVLSSPPHRAYLKIGEGCSNRCSYCLIPSLRGEYFSRGGDSLLAEMDYLVRSGVREVTLVGQDTGRYGTDLGEGSLAGLLESLLSVPGNYWLRVMYVHPGRVTDRLLEVMGSDSRMCPYLDIPFQHAAPGILEKMGRGLAPPPGKVVDKVRASLPGVFLRTTLMTGFPGETGEDFRLLLDFLQEARLDHVGVFAYSREEGTPAALMDGQVEPGLARERAQILMEEQALISSEKLSRFLGKEMTILAEVRDEDGLSGRHQGQAPEVDGIVRLSGEAEEGTFVRARITGSGDFDLEGEVI